MASFSELNKQAKVAANAAELMSILTEAQKPETVNDSTCGDWYIQATAASSPVADDEVLLFLLAKGNSDIAYLVAENTVASAKVLAACYRKYQEMRVFNPCFARFGFAIAGAANTPRTVLKHMTNFLSGTAMSKMARERIS